ncbi:MAG: prepilin-type N-terminal cleavage/methylation domain-containing protein [Nitrospiraceae bacterium]|nr:prepilin-type N-terminal cleavage/methylation domain-containing protein [Nitrospiraceae bacterium]
MQRIETKMQGFADQRGFSLTELLVTVGIAVIMTVIGLYSLSDFRLKSRLASATREMKSDFDMIRMYARANQNGSVIAILTANSYVACVDNNPANGNCDAAETVILNRPQSTYSLTYTVASDNGTPIPPLTLIQYNELGRLKDANRLITLSMGSSYTMQYRVKINQTGLTEALKSSDGTNWLPAL